MIDRSRKTGTPAPSDTADRIDQLRSEARTAIKAGQLIGAYALASDAASLGAERLGLLHAINAESYLLVSDLAGRLGQPALSIVYAQNAYSILEESLPSDDPVAGAVLRALGVAYGRAGDFQSAELFLQAASAFHEDVLGTSAPEIATDLLALARLYLSADNPIALLAVPDLLRRARQIREASFGERSVELAEIWQLQGQTIAEMYAPGGSNAARSPEAIVNASESALRVAEEIYQEHFESPNPVFAPVYRALGDLYLKTGRRDLAFDVYGKALEANSAVPSTADALRLASLAAAEGDAELTLATCRAANTVARESFNEFARWAGIADAGRYRRRANPAQQICLSLIYGLDLPSAEKARALADLTVIWRAAASRSERVRLRQLRHAAGELVVDLGALNDRRRDLSEALIQAIRRNDVSVDAISDQLDEVRRLEEIIALENLVPGGQSSDERPTIQAITDRLGSDAVLLIFQRIDHFDPAARFSAGTDRYVALIVRPDGTVRLRDYGAVDVFDAAALEALTDLRTANPLYPPPQLDAACRLYQMIWAPLAAELAPYERVFIVTDGSMLLVPFAVLRDETGQFLIEAKEILYLTSPADILRDASERAEPEVEALVVAGPDFGLESGVAHERPFAFAPLAAALDELTAIREGLDGEVRVLSGADASKRAIREAPPAHYVHFATHGFFLLNEPVAPLREIDDSLVEAGHDSIAREIALVRSGLALAGANEDRPSEPGILTALEIADMDFSSTELVTLSACETGVGTLETDEGVVGLRQAFELAGARNLIMSLWNVKGAEGRKQMEALYGYLQAGRAPADALRQVQLDRIAWYRAAHISEAPPLVWGAFIVQAHECPCSNR